MNYIAPYTRVTELVLDTSFLSSGYDELKNGNLEPVEYEEF